MIIHPRHQPGVAEKEVQALRVHVDRKHKGIGMPYWDITSQTLIAQIFPILQASKDTSKPIRIKAFGAGPSKRFQVSSL